MTSVLYSCMSPGMQCILLFLVVLTECRTIPVNLGGSMGVFGTTQENMAGCSWKIQVPTSKVQCKHKTSMLDIALIPLFVFCISH